jgi:hypothetical protein
VLVSVHFLVDELFALFKVVVVNITVEVELVNTIKFERLLVNLAHVIHFSTSVQVLDQVEELLVTWVFLERRDWDSVINLVSKGVDSIVHDENVLQVNVLEDAQVFHVNVLLQDAVWSVEAVLDKLSCGINVVDHCVSVCCIACREDAHFVVLICGFEHLLCERPNVEAYATNLSS